MGLVQFPFFFFFNGLLLGRNRENQNILKIIEIKIHKIITPQCTQKMAAGHLPAMTDSQSRHVVEDVTISKL